TSPSGGRSSRPPASASNDLRWLLSQGALVLLQRRAAGAREGGERRAVGQVAGDPVVLERLHDARVGRAHAGEVEGDGGIADAHERAARAAGSGAIGFDAAPEVAGDHAVINQNGNRCLAGTREGIDAVVGAAGYDAVHDQGVECGPGAVAGTQTN